MVSLPTGVQSVVFQLGPTSDRLVCNPVQSQTSSVCFTGAGSDSLGSRCPEPPVGESKRICLPPSIPDSPGGIQNDGSGLSQNDSHCPRLAKHALVLGPGDLVGSDSFQSSSDAPEPQQSESSCLAPRVSTIQRQGFSDEVAERIEAPQRGSTRAVYKSKWAIFVK